jgi:NADH:ubiquinone oxidoreductase subunit
MANRLAVHTAQQPARPLKVLIPLIQSELQHGNDAGREYYRRAGNMLLEAKGQVAPGAWGSWLHKNFDMHATTARIYMRWARIHIQNEQGLLEIPTSLYEMTGGTARDRENRQSKQQQNFRRILRDVARDDFVQERQARDDEVRLHRELAEELVDLGYRALATKLHPDRGGSKDAMIRLNRVRDELKQIAQTRRFV